MTTVSKIRDEFAENFTEHIVTVDHNVPDGFEQEFSFHAICHPQVESDGTPSVPTEIRDYIEKISKNHRINLAHMHVHIYVEVKDESIGLGDVSEEEDLQKVEKE